MDHVIPILDDLIESRLRIINFLTVLNPETQYILEYLYNEGLRRGDIVIIYIDFPSFALLNSYIDDDEPIFHLFDYSLNVITPFRETNEPFL